MPVFNIEEKKSTWTFQPGAPRAYYIPSQEQGEGVSLAIDSYLYTTVVSKDYETRHLNK